MEYLTMVESCVDPRFIMDIPAQVAPLPRDVKVTG